MQITIYKEDKETGRMTQGDAKLENSEYTIYKDEACTDAVETITIRKQDDGSYKATTGNYLVGTYYIKETKRPEGYLIDDTVHKVEQLGVNQNEEFSYHDITSTEIVEKKKTEQNMEKETYFHPPVFYYIFMFQPNNFLL